jgi:hypothetical protein
MYKLLVIGLVAAGMVCTADAQAAADFDWTKSSGGTAGRQLCAGILKTCDSMEACTKTAIGPCTGDSAERYLQSTFVGMGYVDAANYLGADGKSRSDYAKQLLPTGVGYRDAAVVTDGNKKYAYSMAGNIFGDANVAGGYLGLASYLNTGDVDITTQTNDFYVADANNTARVDRSGTGGSAFGAPLGPYTACISDVSSAGCGAARTFKPNEYKFSIFGHIQGSNYSTTVVAGQNGYPQGMSHMGVRMKLEAVGFSGSTLKINDRDYSADRVSDDVTSFAFMHPGGWLNFTFPTKYNLGSTDGAKTDGTMMSMSETKTVKIKIHSVERGSMMIDYLFESPSLSSGKYLVYDPTVTTTPGPTPTNEGTTSPSPVSGAAQRSASPLAGLILAILALARVMQ